MNLKLFGKIKDIVNKEIEISFPISIAALKQNLEDNFPTLSKLEYAVAVNENLIKDENFIVEENAVVALLPPFSGG